MKRSGKNADPNWRPNFVLAAGLPDIKAVRTGFLINFVFLVLMLLVGMYVVQGEYRAHVLGQTVTDKEQRIAAAEAEDSASLNLSREFRDTAAHIVEVEKFYMAPFPVQDFLVEITQMRPEQLIFRQLSLFESSAKDDSGEFVSFRINITGEVRSLTILDEFKGELSIWSLLNQDRYALRIDESLQGRDAETGIFPYTLEITLKPGGNASSTDT